MSLRITDSMMDHMSHRVGVFGRANQIAANLQTNKENSLIKSMQLSLK